MWLFFRRASSQALQSRHKDVVGCSRSGDKSPSHAGSQASWRFRVQNQRCHEPVHRQRSGMKNDALVQVKPPINTIIFSAPFHYPIHNPPSRLDAASHSLLGFPTLITCLSLVRVSPHPEDIHPLQEGSGHPQAGCPLRRRLCNSQMAGAGQAARPGRQQHGSGWHLCRRSKQSN